MICFTIRDKAVDFSGISEENGISLTILVGLMRRALLRAQANDIAGIRP